MTSEGIFLKKVDKKMYRRLKSRAAEKGVPVYTLLNEAIATYVESQVKGSEATAVSQDELDNAAFSLIESDASLQGKWVAIANGKLLATADSQGGVLEVMRQSYAKSPFMHGIVARVGECREEREWLAGSAQRE